MFATTLLLSIVFVKLTCCTNPDTEGTSEAVAVQTSTAVNPQDASLDTLQEVAEQIEKNLVQENDEVCYKAASVPRVWNRPVCKPVCEPKYKRRIRPIYKPYCEPKWRQKWEPKCKPVCEPKWKPEFRPICRPKFNFKKEHKYKFWEPKCKPVCEPKYKHHREHKYKTWEPECKPVCEPKYKHHKEYDSDSYEPECKPVCEPKYKHHKEYDSDSYEPECKPVCEPKYKHHKEYDSDSYDKKHDYDHEDDYEVNCREGYDNDYRTPYGPEEELFRIMNFDNYTRRQRNPVCRPVCEPTYRPRPPVECEPRCEPIYRPPRDCRPRYGPRPRRECEPRCEPIYRPSRDCGPRYGPRPRRENDCLPRWNNECRPVCEPFCKPECDPILKKHHHKKRRRRREVRQDIGLYIRLIRQVLLQGCFEVNKLARCFSEEVKTKLLEGLHLIIKSTGNKAAADLRKLEQRISDVVLATTKNVLRDTEAVITNANENILDNLRANIRLANRTILGEIAALVAAVVAPAVPAIQPLNLLVEILNTSFAELLIDVPTAFKKITQEEKTAVEKIVNDNRNEVIREVAKLIEEFEQKLARHLVGLTDEEVVFIRNIVDQAARKLLVDLQHILHQIGEGIIIIIKGRNCEFRPLLLGIQSDIGWDNVNDDHAL